MRSTLGLCPRGKPPSGFSSIGKYCPSTPHLRGHFLGWLGEMPGAESPERHLPNMPACHAACGLKLFRRNPPALKEVTHLVSRGMPNPREGMPIPPHPTSFVDLNDEAWTSTPENERLLGDLKNPFVTQTFGSCQHKFLNKDPP